MRFSVVRGLVTNALSRARYQLEPAKIAVQIVMMTSNPNITARVLASNNGPHIARL